MRPCRFGPNRDTAASNAFQGRLRLVPSALRRAGRTEFDRLVAGLRRRRIEALVWEDTASPAKPDAVFPNNWLSCHGDGTVFLYPLQAPSRRPERRWDIVEGLRDRHGFRVNRIVDLSPLERQGQYLEGTGSLVLDRLNGLAFAVPSSRTHPAALGRFAELSGYKVLEFPAVDGRGRPLYHTNVVMALGTAFAILCEQAIPGAVDRRRVTGAIEASGRRIIRISRNQMASFAANVLEFRAPGGPVLALSARALASLGKVQRRALESSCELLPVGIDTLERVGGGSVRCMLTEIHLPRDGTSATHADSQRLG